MTMTMRELLSELRDRSRPSRCRWLVGRWPGCRQNGAYSAAAAGTLGVPVLHIGGRKRVPSIAVLRAHWPGRRASATSRRITTAPPPIWGGVFSDTVVEMPPAIAGMMKVRHRKGRASITTRRPQKKEHCNVAYRAPQRRLSIPTFATFATFASLATAPDCDRPRLDRCQVAARAVSPTGQPRGRRPARRLESLLPQRRGRRHSGRRHAAHHARHHVAASPCWRPLPRRASGPAS